MIPSLNHLGQCKEQISMISSVFSVSASAWVLWGDLGWSHVKGYVSWLYLTQGKYVSALA